MQNNPLEIMMGTSTDASKNGILFALISYFTWGASPIYFKLVSEIPAKEILSHRIIWSFALLGLIMLIFRRWDILKKIFQTPKTLLLLTATAITIGSNWFVFIWAIASNQLLEASLGYYINPLMTIVFATIFLHEKLSRFQWMAVGMAFIGVFIQIIMLGTLPWISLFLACTFSSYGLLRKIAKVDALSGLLVETLVLVPFAAGYLFFTEGTQTGALFDNSVQLNTLLILSGLVTTTPLVFFAAATTRLNLATLGFLQYIAPTLMWLLAVFIFHEPVNSTILVTFGFIWMALICFSCESLFGKRVFTLNQSNTAS